MPALEMLRNVIVFDKKPIRYEKERLGCYCREAVNSLMLLCESCNEWFHYSCLGVAAKQVDQMKDWTCGYCLSTPDEHGNQVWNFAAGQSKKKKPAIPLPRNIDNTPIALDVDPDNGPKEQAGPKDWNEICEIVGRNGAAKNKKDRARKKKAIEIVREGGHHIVDHVTNAGVQARGVDAALVDELDGLEFLGVLADGEE